LKTEHDQKCFNRKVWGQREEKKRARAKAGEAKPQAFPIVRGWKGTEHATDRYNSKIAREKGIFFTKKRESDLEGPRGSRETTTKKNQKKKKKK